MTDLPAQRRTLAEAAAQFLGVRFRLYGRDPMYGLDCVGLLLSSLTSVGCAPIEPRGYRLRNSDTDRWLLCAKQSGLSSVSGAIEEGDIILLQSGPAQQHLVIAESPGVFIHAHAGLGKIVRQPMTLTDPILAHWRLIP